MESEYRGTFRLLFAVSIDGNPIMIQIPPEWAEMMESEFMHDNNFEGAIPETPGVYRSTVHAYFIEALPESAPAGGGESEWEFRVDEIEPFEIAL